MKLLRRLVMGELRIWLSIWRFLTRRPRVPAGATAFRYTEPILTVLIIFVVLSAVELFVVDLIVHQWPVVRAIALIVGVWGLTYMIGMLLGFVTRPHAVGPDGIRVRNGPALDLDLRWSDIESVAIAKHSRHDGRSVDFGADGVANIGRDTNLEVVLERPIVARVDFEPREFRVVRFHADDPRGLLAVAREHLRAFELR